MYGTLNEIDIENIHFIPSELNSSDKLTRPQKTEEIFDADSNWFIPNEALNVEGVPHFEGGNAAIDTERTKCHD